MEQTPLPPLVTTRSEEIAGDGPYKADGCVVDGPTLYGIVCESDEKANDLAFSLNAAHTNGYKQVQQDRWVSPAERKPDNGQEVVIEWRDSLGQTRKSFHCVSADDPGWTNGAYIRWTALPSSTPNPEQR